MKRLLLIGLLVVFLAGCGQMEKVVEETKYESLTGKRGTVTLYSGGQAVGHYENAKITYSNSDSEALFFRVDGQEYYWQGSARVELK